MTLEALSMASDKNISKALKPVNLADPELEKEYDSTFFPSRKSTKASPVKLRDFTELFSELKELSIGIENMMDFFRWCLSHGAELDQIDVEQLQARILAQAESAASDNRSLQESSKEKGMDALSMFHSNVSSGSMHIIQPSKRYAGGYDVLFAGMPGTVAHSLKGYEQPTMMLRRGNNRIVTKLNTYGADDKDGNYEANRLQNYETELSQSVVRAAQKCLEMLFANTSAGSVKSAHKRILNQLPLDYDFEKINDTFFTETGIKIPNFVRNINPRFGQLFNRFFRVLAIRSPFDHLVHEQHSAMRLGGEAYDNSRGVSKEGVAIDGCLSFSIAVNLPSELCHFITQVEDTQEVPLFTLHTWVSIWSRYMLRKPGASVLGQRKGEKKQRTQMLPRYVIPASRTDAITEARRKASYYVEEGRNNEDNISVSANGTLAYYPKEGDIGSGTAESYEAAVSEYLKASFDIGSPAGGMRMRTAAMFVVGAGNTEAATEVEALRAKLDVHKGEMISQSWDYDHVMTINAKDPTRMESVNLVGATVPDALAIGDYLGMEFGKNEDGSPIAKTFAESMTMLLSGEAKEPNSAPTDRYEKVEFNDPTFLTETEAMVGVSEFYKYLAVRGKVPKFPELLKEAVAELGLEGGISEHEYERNLYSRQLFDNNFTLKPFVDSAEVVKGQNTGTALIMALNAALNDASAFGQSNLNFLISKEHSDFESRQNALMEDEHYFNPRISAMKDFGNVYNYLGGKIFQLALGHIQKLKPKDLFTPDPMDADIDPEKLRLYGEHPTFRALSIQIMPMVVLFGKYVPSAKEILEQAEELSERNTPDSSIDVSDIKVPGLDGGVGGPQLFPHQVKTHQSLRRRPRNGILDISPGGGKTILGLSDAASCVKEMSELDLKVKPLIIAPDNLVANWCDDMKKLTGNKWNMIPLTNHIWKRWGEDKLEEILADAPPNTMVVAGLNFLKSKPFNVVIGTHTSKVSNSLEFVRRWGFNYIIMDESHKAKSMRSQYHLVVKQLMTASIVKYIRLATGTLINNRVTDIVGQTAMFSAHVFRTENDFKLDHAQIGEDGTPNIGTFGEDAPSVARQKLGRHAAVVTLKRKEWAFMLPNPIEHFVHVGLEYSQADLEDGTCTEKEMEQSKLHQELYETVLEITEEAIEALVKKANAVANGDDDADDSDDDPNRLNMEMDEDEDELAKLNAVQLQTHIARMEQVLTNPQHDPLIKDNPDMAAKFEGYVSAKVALVVDRIKQHFNVEEWERGKEYEELSLVTYKKVQYLLRKQDKSRANRIKLGQSNIPPDEDTDAWKVEPEGKVIVFCRYVPTVEAIYAALPSNLQSIFVRYHGGIADRLANLEALKTDPKVKGIVCTEQAINTGHNLQMCSRIIRVESPWAPGDLDQAEARIFRPDPAAAKSMVKTNKPGELYRDVIWLDWILANGTIDVAKMGRLISKMIEKNQFDEYGNDHYKPLREYDLEPVRMSRETIAATPDFSDITEYVNAYSELNSLQASEFHDMRANGLSTMQSLETEPMLDGSKAVDHVPLLPGQEILDEDGHGLVNGKEFLRQESASEFRADPRTMTGLMVLTDHGRGEIISVRLKTGVKNKDGSLNQDMLDDATGMIAVRLHGSEETIKVSLNEIYVATKLSDEDRAAYEVKDKYATQGARKKALREKERNSKALKKRLDEEDEADRQEEAKAAAEKAKARKAERAKAKKKQEAKKRAELRKKNEKEGKPTNNGITRIPPKKVKKLKDKKLPGGTEVDPTILEDQIISLEPAVMHGFLVLKADMEDPDAKKLKAMKFRETGEYAYVDCNSLKRFYKILDYIESKFKINSKTEKRLEDIQDVFLGDKAKFQSELAPMSELPHFFNVAHRRVKDPKEVRIWPMVLDQSIRLCIDISTSPAVRRHIGKNIPGAVAKWRKAEGMTMYFAKNRSDAQAKVREVAKSGLTVSNQAEALQSLRDLKIRKIKR